MHIIINHLQLKAAVALCHDLAYAARDDQSKCGVVYFGAAEEQRTPALKFACAQESLSFGDTAGGSHESGKGEISSRIGEDSRRVAYGYTHACSHSNTDIFETDTHLSDPF